MSWPAEPRIVESQEVLLTKVSLPLVPLNWIFRTSPAAKVRASDPESGVEMETCTWSSHHHQVPLSSKSARVSARAPKASMSTVPPLMVMNEEGTSLASRDSSRGGGRE